jgi:hypothetical protein
MDEIESTCYLESDIKIDQFNLRIYLNKAHEESFYFFYQERGREMSSVQKGFRFEPSRAKQDKRSVLFNNS